MAPMLVTKLNTEHKTQLLEIAKTSIEHGLESGKPAVVSQTEYDRELQLERASFVSLHINGHLRGCMGKLKAVMPLVQDVAENAFNAAFRDPRFLPLNLKELAILELEISVLGIPEEIQFDSELDLIKQLRPDRDGLILETQNHRGTFLPVVWQYYPKPEEFLSKLKAKAGLREDFWSNNMRCWRYETELIAEKNG